MSDLLAVVTPASVASLTTLATVKSELSITDSGLDAQLQNLIDRASAVVARACGGRVFGQETVSETWRDARQHWYSRGMTRYGAPLILTRAPVSSGYTVTEQGTALVDGTDFEVDTAAGLVWRLSGGCRTDWCLRPLVIAYTAGWLLPGQVGRNLPADIEDVCLELVRRGYHGATRDSSVVMDLTEGVGRIQYAPNAGAPMAVDDELLQRLAPYVRRVR